MASPVTRNTGGVILTEVRQAERSNGNPRVKAVDPTFAPIAEPNAAYLAATKLIDIAGIADFTQVPSITDSIQTVTFSTPFQRLTVPATWATWSSPPFSEDPTPPVLYSQGEEMATLTLSDPSSIFGFELEPNVHLAYTYQVEFFSGGTLVGSITIAVDGNAGARLFAAQTNGPAFDQVVITNLDGPSGGFAIAQVRYTVCKVVVYQEVCLDADIAVDPMVTIGEVAVTCLTTPSVHPIGTTTCAPSQSRCGFTVQAMLCVAVPVSFAVNVTVMDTRAVCQPASETSCLLGSAPG